MFYSLKGNIFGRLKHERARTACQLNGPFQTISNFFCLSYLGLEVKRAHFASPSQAQAFTLSLLEPEPFLSYLQARLDILFQLDF